MSEIRQELRYLESHEWGRSEGENIVSVGITDHAQEALGDVVYVEMPEVGSTVNAGEEAGVVESVKAASDIFSPVSGTVVAINEALEEAPETVNQSPYDDGWFFKVKVESLDELEGAMTAEAYLATVEDA